MNLEHRCKYCKKKILPAQKVCNQCEHLLGHYDRDFDFTNKTMAALEKSNRELNIANDVLLSRLADMRVEIEQLEELYGGAVEVVKRYYEVNS